MGSATDIRWRYQQITRSAGLWTSDAVSEGEYRQAVQGVVAGHLLGEPRAAVEEGTGRVVYAIDAHGRATSDAVQLFSTIKMADVLTAKPKAARRSPG